MSMSSVLLDGCDRFRSASSEDVLLCVFFLYTYVVPQSVLGSELRQVLNSDTYIRIKSVLLDKKYY